MESRKKLSRLHNHGMRLEFDRCRYAPSTEKSSRKFHANVGREAQQAANMQAIFKPQSCSRGSVVSFRPCPLTIHSSVQFLLMTERVLSHCQWCGDSYRDRNDTSVWPFESIAELLFDQELVRWAHIISYGSIHHQCAKFVPMPRGRKYSDRFSKVQIASIRQISPSLIHSLIYIC